MSFPYHDQFWTGASDFLKCHVRTGESVLAPDIFWWQLDRIYRYRHATAALVHDWAVIHKGEVGDLHPGYCRAVMAELRPVFANDVFVILTRRNDLPAIDRTALHVRPLVEIVDALPQADTRRDSGRLDAMSPDAITIVKFETLDADQFRDEMNWFWKSGGYLYITERDKAYFREIDSYIAEYLGECAGEMILDLCCGNGRLQEVVRSARRIVGIDVSDVAIEFARERHRGHPGFEFTAMDAAALSYPDASFDTVLFVDAIEHVREIGKVFSEISRVLKPGGRLLTTVANTDSVNQIISAKLGHPRFKTNYQHIQEYNLAEFENLALAHGFSTAKSGGIFLFPYWGLPGIDEIVTPVIDRDPELVELFRQLGRRIGPEHAYSFVVLSVKD